ncbi:hypothetical protein ACQP2U_42630 (plasmid) [Nocardia sp. CA-084685]|uniref:hypothetical protein n=1 Tax=Nocardia sp. CA-084685 TaxID=3239970 RepID=UPI003D98F6A9
MRPADLFSKNGTRSLYICVHVPQVTGQGSRLRHIDRRQQLGQAAACFLGQPRRRVPSQKVWATVLSGLAVFVAASNFF